MGDRIERKDERKRVARDIKDDREIKKGREKIERQGRERENREK